MFMAEMRFCDFTENCSGPKPKMTLILETHELLFAYFYRNLFFKDIKNKAAKLQICCQFCFFLVWSISIHGLVILLYFWCRQEHDFLGSGLKPATDKKQNVPWLSKCLLALSFFFRGRLWHRGAISKKIFTKELSTL